MSKKDAPINVSVTFRNTESTEALKSYATEKIIHCLRKFAVSPTEVHIVLSVQKRDHAAEVRLTSKRFDISSSAVTGDLYSAIDKVMDTLAAQIRKEKERIVNHKHAASVATP